MRKALVLCTALLVAIGLTSAVLYAQQDKSKRPSPPASATCELASGKSVTIDYSSPRAKGRKVFGGLVPYGEVWRAGANEATTFVITSDVKVGDAHVPAGSYTLFTLPEQNKWTLIVSKKTGEWGIPYPGDKDDLVRVPMTVGKTSAPVDDFKISLDKAGNGCTLKMEWENTNASVKLEAM